MHAKHVENLRTLLANIKCAILDRYPTIIGGGEFSPEEMLSLRLAVESQLAREEAQTKQEDSGDIAIKALNRLSSWVDGNCQSIDGWSEEMDIALAALKDKTKG